MSIPARLLTTVIAGLAGYAVVGLYTILTGPIYGVSETIGVMVLFTATYVPGVFGARRALVRYGARVVEGLASTSP